MSRQLTRTPLCGDCSDGWIEDEDGNLIERCPCRYVSPTGQQLRDRGIRKAEVAHPGEKEAARRIVKDAAEEWPEFDANKVRPRMVMAGVVHTALIGGAFTWASNQGLIEDTGRTERSTDEGTHVKKLAVWRSLHPKWRDADSPAAHSSRAGQRESA